MAQSSLTYAMGKRGTHHHQVAQGALPGMEPASACALIVLQTTNVQAAVAHFSYNGKCVAYSHNNQMLKSWHAVDEAFFPSRALFGICTLWRKGGTKKEKMRGSSVRIGGLAALAATEEMESVIIPVSVGPESEVEMFLEEVNKSGSSRAGAKRKWSERGGLDSPMQYLKKLKKKAQQQLSRRESSSVSASASSKITQKDLVREMDSIIQRGDQSTVGAHGLQGPGSPDGPGGPLRGAVQAPRRAKKLGSEEQNS